MVNFFASQDIRSLLDIYSASMRELEDRMLHKRAINPLLQAISSDYLYGNVFNSLNHLNLLGVAGASYTLRAII